jgi:anaerobic magnesium-protoporphyrin IX monomethyl ester cyclase
MRTRMKTLPNILFINPSPMAKMEQAVFLEEKLFHRVPDFQTPIGIIEMASYLRQEIPNISVSLLDISADLYLTYQNHASIPSMTVEEFTWKAIDKCEYQPDIIGISILYSSSFNSSMLIADMARKKWPDATIVCGGIHATHYANYILDNPSVDWVVRGEGELSFTEFVRKIGNEEDPGDVLGIVNKEQAQQQNLHDQMSPMLQDLDLLPIPAYDLLDMELYISKDKVSAMFARGCPFKCTFCASPSVHGHELRDKTNPRILQELNYLIEHYRIDRQKVGVNRNHIMIQDDLIAARKTKFIELAKDLKKLKLKFGLPNALCVDVFDEKLIDTVSDLGIDYFQFAIESGSEYTQKHLINKGVPLEKAKRLVKYTKSKDQRVFVSLILGVPNETKELMEESINYYRDLDVDWAYIFTALPLPGTKMFQQFLANGVMDEASFDWDGVRHGKRTFDTEEITAEELEILTYDTNIELNFFNNSNIRNGRYQEAIDIFNYMVLDLFPYQIVARYCRGVANLHLKKYSEAKKDFEECVLWIGKNSESKRLFNQYRSQMPNLDVLLSEDTNASDLSYKFSTKLKHGRSAGELKKKEAIYSTYRRS